MLTPVWWTDGLRLIDQTRLPWEERILEPSTVAEVVDAIRRLCVRGAPAIGVTAAYGVVVGLHESTDPDIDRRFDEIVEALWATRPTAINLAWALRRQRRVFERHRGSDLDTVLDALLCEAERIQAQDIAANQRLGAYGADLLQDGDRVLTHCNAGALATAGHGTALGVIRSAWAQGKRLRIWVDETRPLLQGGRLTAWELETEGIPYEVVTDNAVGALMGRGLVDAVITGSDRVAANGDVANKIGTYTVAVMADRHDVPFFAALPTSTIDPDVSSGDDIPIEQRDPEEVTNVYGVRIAPMNAAAINYAFDVTPHDLVDGLITEVGILEPPYEASIRRALDTDGAVHGSAA